jgi:lipoprotein Spr
MMIRKFILAFAAIIFFGSCTSLKQLGFTGNRQNTSLTASATTQNEPTANQKTEIKFLDNISTSTQPVSIEVSSNLQKPTMVEQTNYIVENNDIKRSEPEPLQVKYASIMGTEASEIDNLELFMFIDEWYGTRYRLGGTTKRGIDCSALVQLLFSSLYSIPVPRTSKEQYKFSKRVSLTELQEGDLLFYHTRGRGVSHVGVYLSNNKFLHAASSGGVMISDMYDPYFVKRFIGAGRILK